MDAWIAMSCETQALGAHHLRRGRVVLKAPKMSPRRRWAAASTPCTATGGLLHAQLLHQHLAAAHIQVQYESKSLRCNESRNPW